MGFRDSSTSWRDRFAAAVAPCRGRGVVVAVSGGSDSVGLLGLMHEARERLDLRLSVAHLDHGARGDASVADGAFVADLAASLGLPFDLGRWAPARPGHFESDARRARYAWLTDVARSRGARFVAVGHTRDDQAETILHRIVRGTGPKGLAGIPARRRLADGITLIRPLLTIGRDEVRADLSARNQPFREDASNADTRRTRNKIRHDLLPKLAREYNPRVAEALVRLGNTTRDQHAWSRGLDLHERAATVAVGPLAIVLRAAALAALPLSIRAEIVRRAWRRAGWPEGGMTADHWLRLAASVDEGPSRFAVTGGIEARRGDDVLTIARARESAPDPPPQAWLSLPGEATWGRLRLIASFEPNFIGGEAIDLDRVETGPMSEGLPGLWVRSPRDGDRFDPLGLGGKTQALNDFFRGRGRGVAKRDRADVPIVGDATGILWVVGHRIADRVKRTEITTRVLNLGHVAR